MPVKISSTEKTFVGSFISKGIINQLVKNFITHCMKIEVGSSTPRKMDPEKDAFSIWFSKEEIDQLMADNTTKDQAASGIRIYFGYHGNSETEILGLPNRPTDYVNHHTAILVSTYKNEKEINCDILKEGASISVGGAAGMGLDEGSIAPPPYPIPGSLVDPT